MGLPTKTGTRTSGQGVLPSAMAEVPSDRKRPSVSSDIDDVENMVRCDGEKAE
jgi:hypothetical protein